LDSNDKIKALLDSQKLAVLSTLADQQPYCSLIAFAECEGCREILFFTPKNTRKYQNLISNNRVALMIDDRSNQSLDFKKATALTLIGLAEEIDLAHQPSLLAAFIHKHPNLADSTTTQDNAFFKIKITDYILAGFDHTLRFQI